MSVNVKKDVDMGNNKINNVLSVSRDQTNNGYITRAATAIVAANDALEASKAQADYVCDGTNDEEKINNAIENFSSVQLSEGTFWLGGSINLDDRTVLQGRGMSITELRMQDGANTNMVEYVPTGSTLWFFSAVKDLKIVGNKENNSSGIGIYSSGDNGGAPSDFWVQRVFVHKMPETGFYLTDQWGLHLHHFLSETNDAHGIQMRGDQLHISGGYVAYNEKMGIKLSKFDKGNMIDVGINDNGYHGLLLGGKDLVKNSSFTDLIIQNNNDAELGQSGIYIKGTNLAFTNCHVYDDKSPGTQHKGFYFRNAENIRVHNSKMWGNTDSDVNIYSDSSDIVVENNYFTSLTDGGTGTIIRHNTGYITEKSGSVSISDGDTIAHGLDDTPTYINLTAATDGHIAVATAVDGTNITIGLHDDAGNAVTTDETIYWEAKVR